LYTTKSDIVYKVNCSNCDAAYVGETGRQLGQRIKEHSAALRLIQPQKSALAQHAVNTAHDIDWASAAILDREAVWKKRRWKESYHIARTMNNINRDDGLILPPQYTSLL
jgi:hypothetical protein